jgi:hypothetical protein
MKPTDEAGIGASRAERLLFERLLADLSAAFANVLGDGVIDEIASPVLNKMIEGGMAPRVV